MQGATASFRTGIYPRSEGSSRRRATSTGGGRPRRRSTSRSSATLQRSSGGAGRRPRPPRRRDAALAGPLPAALEQPTGSSGRPDAFPRHEHLLPGAAGDGCEPRLQRAADERYVAPLPGRAWSRSRRRSRSRSGPVFRPGRWPRTCSSRARRTRCGAVVLAEPFLARGGRRPRRLADALDVLHGGPKLALWITFGDAAPARAGRSRSCRSTGSGSTSIRRPRRRSRAASTSYLLAGVLDARNSLPRSRTRSRPLPRQRSGRPRRRPGPERRPAVRVRADRAREALAPREAKTATEEEQHDRGTHVPDPRDRIAGQAVLAGQDLRGPPARRLRHRARPQLGRAARRRRTRGARRPAASAAARTASTSVDQLVEPLRPRARGEGRPRRRLRRRAAALRDVRRAVAHANGFDWRGSVRSFDNKYYSKAAVDRPDLAAPSRTTTRSSRSSSRSRQAELKVPITGAYTHRRSGRSTSVPHRHVARAARRRSATPRARSRRAAS